MDPGFSLNCPVAIGSISSRSGSIEECVDRASSSTKTALPDQVPDLLEVCLSFARQYLLSGLGLLQVVEIESYFHRRGRVFGAELHFLFQISALYFLVQTVVTELDHATVSHLIPQALAMSITLATAVVVLWDGACARCLNSIL